MKKIALISNNDNIVFYFRREIILSFLKKGCHVCLITPVHGHLSSFETYPEVEIIPIELERRGTNPSKDLRFYHSLLAILKHVRPDVVFSYTIKPNVYGSMACRRLHIPCFPNITGLGDAMENSGLVRTVALRLSRHAYKHCAGVFMQNEANRSFFVGNKVVREKQIRMIPGSGVNLERFSYQAYPSEANGIRIIFVGRLLKDKGLFEFLEATRAFASRKDVKFFIAGSAADSDYDIPQLLKSYRVTYLGLLSKPELMYRNYHVIVLPSYHEGMSNVLLEASATGRPVITTTVPGCRETFDEGVSGIGCEPRNTASLVDALRRFLALSEIQHAQMGIAGRKKMEQQFSRELVVQAYQKAVAEVVGE
ncbi:MAG: glycosyltransferase family 4 protein [Spirochaetia bacterium]|jgi:galacturonosyltransferase|nr:glycosyltransferase family 4 protein [Spirochaetia bacterium]